MSFNNNNDDDYDNFDGKNGNCGDDDYLAINEMKLLLENTKSDQKEK